MKAITFDTLGSAVDRYDVLQLHDLSQPAPGRHEAVVRMLLAPVNWSDFIFIAGHYAEPRLPRFPGQIAGITGVGVVVETGAAVKIRPGTVVSFSHPGSWAEYAVVPEAVLIPVPDALPLHVAAQIGNPITAWDLVARAEIPPDGFLIVTAAYSNVARCIAQFAARRGVRVLGIVRHAEPGPPPPGYEAIADLSRADTPIMDQIAAVTRGRAPGALIDCVGGPLVGEVARILAPNGKIIIYGTLGDQQLGLTNPLLMSRLLRLETYAYRYFSMMPAGDRAQLQEVLHAMTEPGLDLPQPEAFHPLNDFRMAVDRHFDPAVKGKQFIRIAAETAPERFGPR